MQLLIDKGWKMYYSCMCHGTLKEYWTKEKHKNYEIRIRPRRNTYSLLLNNMIIKGPDWLYKLENTLKEYGIEG